MNDQPVALITGGAQRIGAEICRTLHQAGFGVIIHYRHSSSEAEQLAKDLNQLRNHCAAALYADLNYIDSVTSFISKAQQIWGRLDVLINNASSFFPTSAQQTTEKNWDELMNPNLKAPYFLAQAAAPFIKEKQGCIINIADVHGIRPLEGYPVYSIAKAGLIMLTKALARELSPDIRVNAIAPGVTLLPKHKSTDEIFIKKLIDKTLLKRFAAPQDIADAIVFLINQQSMTGQVLNIDCGRSLRQ